MKKSIFLFFAAILCAIGMNAATPTKIYLNAQNWGYGDARYAAYFFDPAKWVDMKKVDGETFIYEVDVPAGYTKVILCRMNGGTTANNWDNRWNQTGNLDIPTDGRNMFKPDDWNGQTTTWSTYAPTVTHTFAKNSTLYIDFRAITDKKGANYPKAGTASGLDYSANAGGTVIPVTFTADVKWTEGAEFMKTEKGDWTPIPFKAPAAGQNCAQVAADGKSYTWTTYSEPTVTLSLDKESADAGTEVTVTLTATADNVAGEVTYAFQYSTDNTTWNNISSTGNTATQTFAAETRYYKVTMTNGGNTKEATAKFSAIKFHVIGSWDNWNTHNETVEGDVTLALEANKTYEYKITNGTWDIDWGNDGTMTRDNCTDWSFESNNNAKITTDEAGNYVFNVSRNDEGKVKVSVTYPVLTYTVNATAENGTVTGAGPYKEGTKATLTAAPAEGYEFVSWTKGEEVVSTENPYTFTVTANVDLVANFKKSVVTHDFSVEDVTVTKGQWSIDLAGSWNEQAFVLRLWQDNTQGFGTYAANAETGYSATLGVKELTPTAEGYYMQDPMNENAFIFQGTMTDGADIYEVYLKGALASESETGEMEAKTEVAFSCNADGVWSIEASADDYSWGLMLEVVPNLETSEYVATGYYVTDIEAGVTEEVAGTGMLYFDDFSGCQVFKGNLTTESGNIYPTLYASSLDLITNEIMTGPSWIGEIAGVDYYEVLLMANNYLWELDLHARNCTGDPGTYTVDIVDVEEGAYSTFMSASAVTGELTIYEDNSYEANVTTVDNEGNPAMSISVSAWAAAAEEYNIVITNATVTENTFGYYIDMIGEWEGHTIKVEVCDELDTETIWANFFIDGGIANDGDQAEGTVEATVNEGVVTITGTFECLGSGAVYNVTISGTLPGGTTTSLDNLNTTVAPVKMIENGQLIIINNGVQYNAQGAVIK